MCSSDLILAAGGLFLRKYDGTLVWFIPYDGPIFQSNFSASHVSVADLDNDGIQEIVVTCYSGGAVFVFEPDGSVRPGWPVIIQPFPGWGPPPIDIAASLGDVDNDGLNEIIFGTSQGQFICLKPDGSYCPGFPVLSPTPGLGWGPNPILYDLNGDGTLEIFLSNLPELNFIVMDYQGNVIQTLPLTSQFLTLGDPDNDSIKEIGFLAQGGYHLFEMAGFTELPNFPVDFAGTNYEGWAMMRALFADIGGTSQEEVVSGSS